MKLFRTILICASLCLTTHIQAQGLGGLLKSAASAVTQGDNNTGNFISGLLGTVGIKTSSIEGTWNYKTPCLVFESENMLSTMAGNLVSNKVNSYLNTGISKAGIKPGCMQLTFAPQGVCHITLSGKSMDAQYTLKENVLTLTFPITRQSVPMNVRLQGNTLQFAMKADKLLTLVKGISGNAASSTTALNSISALLKNYNGMYLGLQFNK